MGVISGLTQLTTPDRAVDELAIVDDSESDITKKTKRINVSDLLGDLDDITATSTEVNTTCDGPTAKNSHTHTLATGASDVTASAAEVTAIAHTGMYDSKGIIVGNATAPSTIRTTFLMIWVDGSGNFTCQATSIFNSFNVDPTITVKGTPNTYFSLDVSGTTLQLLFTKPDGEDVVAVISSSILYDATGVSHLAEIHQNPSDKCVMIQDITVTPGDGSAIDMTTLTATKTLEMYITWVTQPTP